MILNFNYLVKKLQLRTNIISRIGRNNKGRQVCFTKQKKKNNLNLLLNLNFRIKNLSLVIGLKLLPNQFKFFSLVYTLEGGFFHLPANINIKLFSFIYLKTSYKTLSNVFPHPFCAFIFQLKNLSKVSFIENIPGKGGKYVKSAGSYAVLTKLNFNNHLACLLLPSGISKYFSIYSLVILGSVLLNRNNLITNTKSGFWRNLGIKPKVRGVAKNPVDHPHGGRTKSIKYPRTPWGKTTKFK